MSLNKQASIVFSRYKKWGLFTDINENVIDRQVMLDSTFKTIWLENIFIYSTLTENTATLIESEVIPETKVLKEVYSLKGIKDTSLNGTITLQFKPIFNYKGFSLSKELDSVKQMTLYSVRIVSNGRYSPIYQTYVDTIRQGFELAREDPIDSAIIIKEFSKENLWNYGH